MQGLQALLTVQSLVYLTLGVLFGLVVGFLPGLGGIVAMALLLPFISGVEPAAALSLLLGAWVATDYGSSITGILFNVPGAAKSLTAMFDGYPMTRRGEGARALAASCTANLVGGIVGAVCLTVTLPFMRAIMLALGPSEYFMMAVWGLSVLAIFTDGSMLKGFAAAGLGLLVSFVGMDPVTGTARYTLGTMYLIDGVDFTVAVIGLFAISQMMTLYVKGGSILERSATKVTASAWEGVKDVFRHWRLVLQSSVLGLFIGVLPGVGATVGGLAAYAQAMRSSRHPERFGKGAVEGIIAPDATTAANAGGGLVPTLGFGIPGGESMAILMSAFITMGIAPGREMLEKHLDVTFTIVWIIVGASIIVAVIGVATANVIAKVTMIPGNIMIPAVLAICFVGAYAVRGRLIDVAVAAAFGLVGYLLEKYEYSRSTFVIGMVLGLMVERYLHISLTLYGNLFFITRPWTAVLLALVLFTVIWPFVRLRLQRKQGVAA